MSAGGPPSKGFPASAWVDGRVLPAAEAKVPLEDRGFLFGESVYEVFLSIGGHVFARDEHFERLRRSGAGVGIEPGRFTARVEAAVAALLAEAGSRDALIYLQVTGGAGPRDHLPPVPPLDPGVYATIRPFDTEAMRGLQSRGQAAIAHPENRWAHASWKSTQLLGSIFAKREARARGAEEAIFVDVAGRVLEGASTNVFVVKGGIARTPPLSRNLLPGVTRRLLLERCEGRVIEADVKLGDLRSADEVFIASTTRPVIGIVTLDGSRVGAGVPGPLTLALAREVSGWMRL